MPMSVCFGVEARGGRLSVCHPFRDAGLPDRYWVAGEGRAVAVSGCRAGVGPVVGDSLVVHAVEVTTDKDGIILCLLASEITAVTGCTPSEHYADLVARFGDPAYARTDVPATPEQKAVPLLALGLAAVSPVDLPLPHAETSSAETSSAEASSGPAKAAATPAVRMRMSTPVRGR